MSPLAPIAIRTTPPSRPVAAPSSASGMQSLKRRAETAILTTSAPAARMVRARSARSAGTDSKSCDDRTIRRPPVWRRRSSNPARHSTSTNSAPLSSASPSIRRRSSSDPSKRPPSHAGRQVTMTGTRRPASAPATSGSLTPSSLSSTRSASRTASRRWRSSAVDVAVTVTHRRGFGISSGGPKGPHYAATAKKKASSGLSEEARDIARGKRSGQGDCLFSRAPIPPPCSRGGALRLGGKRKRAEQVHSASHRDPDDSRGARRCQFSCPFLLDQ